MKRERGARGPRAAAVVLGLGLVMLAGCTGWERFRPEELPLEFRLSVPAAPGDPLEVSCEGAFREQDVLRVRAPAGMVGAYAPERFGAFIQDLRATGPGGEALVVSRREESVWEIQGPVKRLEWKVDAAGGEQGLASPHAPTRRRPGYTLLSGYATWLILEGEEHRACRVSLELPPGWRCAWALSRVDEQSWLARDLFELIDEPAALGAAFATADAPAEFMSSRVHVFVEDAADLVAATNLAADVAVAQRAAVKAVAALGLEPPGRPYQVFFEMLRPGGGRDTWGAMEHGSSMHAIAPVGRDLARNPGPLYMAYHLTHHILHAWLPRRLYTDALHPGLQLAGRPTSAIWFAEGFPQYLAGVGLARAGVATPEECLEFMARRFLAGLRQDDGASQLSLAALSKSLCGGDHRAWRRAYSGGGFLAWLIDEQLHAAGREDLMAVVRALLARWDGDATGIPETRLERHLSAATGLDVGALFARHVHGNEALPVQQILADAGVILEDDRPRALPSESTSPSVRAFRDSVLRAP